MKIFFDYWGLLSVKEKFLWVIVVSIIAFTLYVGIATRVFMYKHPKVNDMIIWHEPKAVLTFGTVEEYK
jgi:hypothetical protein